MSTAIALADQPLSEQWKYAQALAQAGLLPKPYRERPGDVLLAMAYAQSLDIPVAQVFTGVHVIEGRPSMSAELMAALVRRAGHRIRMTGDDRMAAAEIVRRDDPEFTYRARFTLEDAARAGLMGKDVWKKYPAAMLLARAVSAVCRSGAADVLAGVSYVPEEIGGAPDYVEEAPVARTAIAEPVEVLPLDAEPVRTQPEERVGAEPPAEPPKRKRRTKAEMEAARAAEETELAERMAENEARLAEGDLVGPSDPEGEERQEQTVAEANTGIWEEAWLDKLERATEAGNRAEIGVLGSEASAGNRGDLLKLARTAWNNVQTPA